MAAGQSATILFTWELGGGWGHIAPHAGLISRLVEHGNRVVFALRDVTYAEKILGPLGVSYVQAPIHHTRVPDAIEPAYHYAHILHNTGFANPDSLFGLVRSWHTLFDLIEPDLVISDHSPTVLLASRARPHKTVATGTGFAIPPDRSPLPVLRRTSLQNASRLQRDEQRVLDNINCVLKRLGGGPLARVTQLFTGCAAIFHTFKEFDHYGARTEIRYWGSWETSFGAKPEWPAADGPKIFAYLKPFQEISGVLEALNRLGAPTIIYGNIDAATKERYTSPTLRFSPQPLDMQRVGAECDMAILNATHASLADMLLAGKPVLLVPLTLEQYVLAERVEKLGACLRLTPGTTDHYVKTLRSLLELPRYRDAARRFAARYAGVDRKDQLDALVDSIEALLA